MIAKLDRLSRSVFDFVTSCWAATRQGWSSIAIDLGIHKTTSTGQVVAGLLMQIDEWEAKIVGERTNAALAAAKRNYGVVPGPAG